MIMEGGMLMRASRIALALLLSAGLGACAVLPRIAQVFQHHHAVKITPIPAPLLAAAGLPDDSEYSSAAHAIEVRDYAAALDYLQAARERKADDVRVLNAFGVVYDKLGRFDVSARYYAQAQALDPNSPIIAQNIAYSALLQGKTRFEAPLPALALTLPPPAASPAPAGMTPKLRPALASATPSPAASAKGGIVQVAPGVMRLELAANTPSPVLTLPTLTGHPLMLVDATGVPGTAEPLRAQLSRLGWTAKPDPHSSPTQATSEIVYATDDRIAAQALARTLGRDVRMQDCGGQCVGVRLVLGADAVGWKHHAGRSA
jgi:hypothetical protein